MGKIKVGFSLSPIREKLKECGVERITHEALLLVKNSVEAKARFLAVRAIQNAKHAKRKKVTAADIKLAIGAAPSALDKKIFVYLDARSKAGDLQLALAQIRRFIKVEGAELVAKDALEAMNLALMGYIKEICAVIVQMTPHRKGSKTANKEDILLAIKYQD